MASNSPPAKNSPLTAFEKARLVWFQLYGSAVVGSNRLFIVTLVVCITCIGQGIAIMSMLPLKTVVPYIVKVNNDGMVTSNPVEMSNYTPGDAEKKYFLSDWSVKLLTLDRYLTNKNLLDAYERVRDKATNEFADFVATNKPAEALKLDTQLTRGVKIRSVAFISEGAALVRLVTETRAGQGQSYIRKNMIITVHYTLVPPKTEQEIFSNPIGMYITHFSLSEDLN